LKVELWDTGELVTFRDLERVPLTICCDIILVSCRPTENERISVLYIFFLIYSDKDVSKT